jgi:peptidoglycan/LPS O-acetylase OafA/YrhL
METDEFTKDKPLYQSPHVIQLDGLRGLLALWVAVSHIFCWCGIAEREWPWPFRRFREDFFFAIPAVETFMIVSGFAISALLHQRRRGYLAYMIGRLFRLYPTYIICLLLGVVSVNYTPVILGSATWNHVWYLRMLGTISMEERANFLKHLVAHITLLFGLFPRSLLPEGNATILAPGWSLTLEWQYYLAAPLIAWLVRNGTGVLFAMVIAFVGVRYGYAWKNPSSAFLPAQLPMFLIGIATYHLYTRSARLGNGKPADFTLPCAAVLGVALLTSWHMIALSIWAIAFGSVSTCSGDPFSRGLRTVKWILCHRWVQFLGKISYPLYLIHWPIIVTLLYWLLRFRPSVTSEAAALLLLFFGMPLILLAAFVLHKRVEAPGMSIGKRLASRVAGTRVGQERSAPTDPPPVTVGS